MAEKIFKTRIKQRRDTSANWESKNPVLLNGEVIIVDTANGETRTKTGDGTKTYTQLPFDDEGSKGGKSLIDKSFADNVSTSGNTTTIDKQLKTYSVTTRLEADVVITGLDENGQEVTRHKLSEKVDKVSGKSLIDENVSKQVVYNPNDNYVHVDYKYTKGSGLDCSGIKIQRLSREDETSDYEASETLPYTELSGATVKLKTPDNEASVELSTTGFTIDNNKEQSSPSILLGTKAGDIIVHNYTTNEQHYLSKKANASDVLTKTNTTEFTPTADYQPATKKYVDNNKLSNIANGETTGTIKIGRTGAQRTDGPYSTAIGFAGHTSADALGSIAMCAGECLASYTVAMGLDTAASGDYQLVQGKYNVKDTESKYAYIIGNGTSDTARSNAHTVDWNGNAWFAGDIEGTKDGATHKLSEKANTTDIALLQYYGTTDITISDSSYFTVNETGETITGLTDVGKTQTELVIPYKINGVKITTLFSGSDGISRPPVSILNGNSTITKVVIPKSVTTLGGAAFANCKLSSINIPNSVTNIGVKVFRNCSYLTSVYISDSVTSIGDYAFEGCNRLTSINIPNSVTSIGDYAFVSCTGLRSVNIPDSVTSIGSSTFSNCTALTSIDIPNSVTSIGDSAFNNIDPATLTIYCEQGSYAETFAKSKNISIIYTDIKEVKGKSLIDENVANNIEYYKDSSGYPHIQISPAGPSNMQSCVFSYDGLKITETTHPSHSVILSTSEGLIIEGEMDVSLRKGSSGGTLHKLSEKAEAKTYTVSVPTTSWTEKTDTDNQKYYYKKITVSGMTASGQAMTDVAMSDSVATARKEMEAYQCVNRVVTGNGYVELYCFEEVPTTAFTLRILVISNVTE